MYQYLRFLFGGGFNTLVSVVSFYFINQHFSEPISLAGSFWITFFVSYLINSRFVFRTEQAAKVKFLLAVCIAFIVQQLVGKLVLMFGGRDMLVFIIVSLVHVPFFFILCRHWVFKYSED